MADQFASDKVLTRTLFNNFGHLLVFVFYAEWNEPSVHLKNNLIDTIPLFGQFPNVKYFTIAAEKCPQTFKKFSVEHTPTVLFTQTDKKILKKFETDDVGVIFDSLAEESQAHRSAFEQQKKIWHPKIKSILNESPVIVFIKGTPQTPKCGFTETMLNILKEQKIEYNYYDIIEDEYMRYWLRNYSGWPTYPQIYSQGQLIGGLDTVKELVTKGEFIQLFPKSCRVTSVQEKLEALVSEHPLLVFTNGFTFQNNGSEATMKKISQAYQEKNLYIYNLSLDQALKRYLLETTKKDLPLVFEEGKIKEI